jgi:hypothetical protein
MFWLAAILMALWLLGVATANTFGGFVHLLLLVSIAVVLIELTMGKAGHGLQRPQHPRR